MLPYHLYIKHNVTLYFRYVLFEGNSIPAVDRPEEDAIPRPTEGEVWGQVVLQSMESRRKLPSQPNNCAAARCLAPPSALEGSGRRDSSANTSSWATNQGP